MTTLSGRRALAIIEETWRDIEAREAGVVRELEEGNAERLRLEAERLDMLGELARVRRGATVPAVAAEMARHAEHLRGVAGARDRSIRQWRERRAAAEAGRGAFLAREQELSEALAALDARLDGAAEKALASLSSDPVYVGLAASRTALAETLANAEAKAIEAAGDEFESTIPYRRDPLFMYLWERRMGPAPAKPGVVVRHLDEWVAGLTRFAEFRIDYALLTEIPIRLRAHAADLRRQAAAAKASLDDLLADRTRVVAGEGLLSALDDARRQRAELDRDQQRVNSEIAEADWQLLLYARAEDQPFRAAMSAVASLLDSESVRRLRSDAAATDTREDERLSEALARVDDVLESAEASCRSRRPRLTQLADRKADLLQILAGFKRRKLDDAASQIGDQPPFEELLHQLVRGTLTARACWEHIERRQAWLARPADPLRRRMSMAPFDRDAAVGSHGDRFASRSVGEARISADVR